MITYIIPSFNQGEYISYTLQSVISNMASEDQLIIADGASTDCTYDVVRPFLGDSRIEWFSEPDRGFSDAMSKALRRARNPIIGIMSSDDAYLPGIRDHVVKCFADSEVVLAYADYELIDRFNRKIGERRHRAGDFQDFISLRILLPQSSVFFRMDALKGQNILDLEYDYIADVVLFNQVCQQGKFVYVPVFWSQVRKHAGSRTGKRNPGVQYLKAVDGVFGSLSSKMKKEARAGALLLRARYEASSQQRLRAISSLTSAFLAAPLLVGGHWLLPRTIGYILSGPSVIDHLKRMLRGI